MPNYVPDPDSPGKHIDVIELQRRNPYKTLPPVLITDWLKHDLWTRLQAIQLLAGYLPDNPFSIINPKRYLDRTSDEQLSPLKHPLRDEILANIMSLSNWAGLSEANETKPPQEWLSWAKEKRFTPYWLEYVEAIQSAPNPPLVDGTVTAPPVPPVEITTDEILAALFDPVPVQALEKMFPAEGAWKTWAEKARSNKLIDARVSRGKFNPYKAGLWLVRKGAQGWDDARLYRVLANNLPARSLDDKCLLTGYEG